jgi:hypothetical protein
VTDVDNECKDVRISTVSITIHFLHEVSNLFIVAGSGCEQCDE